MQGRVCHWSSERGFGFITPDGADTDIFVHVLQITNADFLSVGDRVEFDTTPDGKRQRAANVVVLS